MTPFHPQQSNRGRRVRKNANANTFNFTSQIAPPICAVMHTEHDKSDATIFKSLCKRMAVSKCFYRVEALPLVWTRFLRLAKSSPKTARSPARRSRDSRATSGKTSGEISAQLPGNSRATAGQRQPQCRRMAGRMACKTTCLAPDLDALMSAPETCETTRLKSQP